MMNSHDYLDTLDPVKYEVVTPPSNEPYAITTKELGDWLSGVPETDPILVSMIVSAQSMCESYLGCVLFQQTLAAWYDTLQKYGEQWWDGVRELPINEVHRFPGAFVLNKFPVSAVNAVRVYDREDVSTEAAANSYYQNLKSTWPSVVLRHGFTWPTVNYRIRDVVEVEFVAGYGTTRDTIPASMKNGIKALAAYLYEHRACDADEAIKKSGASQFWSPYRRTRI